MPHFVYILHSPNHDRYYIGESQNVARRLVFHNQLNTKGYTRKFRPWVIVVKLKVDDYKVARKIERHIKRQKSRRYIECLISDKAFREALIAKFSSSLSGPAVLRD